MKNMSAVMGKSLIFIPMIKVKGLIKEIHDVETIHPRDIFNLYYLEYMISQHPEISKTSYGKETVQYYLQQLKEKYVRLFSKLLYFQILKYVQRGRVDHEFDKTKLSPDMLTRDLKDLMNHTFRSDMTRRNTVWNAVADYTHALDYATTPSSIMVNLNGLNNAVHNTGGKIIDDPGKVPNYRELRNAFDTADRIKNQNQWELIKTMVDKDIRDLMNQSDELITEGDTEMEYRQGVEWGIKDATNNVERDLYHYPEAFAKGYDDIRKEKLGYKEGQMFAAKDKVKGTQRDISPYPSAFRRGYKETKGEGWWQKMNAHMTDILGRMGSSRLR